MPPTSDILYTKASHTIIGVEEIFGKIHELSPHLNPQLQNKSPTNIFQQIMQKKNKYDEVWSDFELTPNVYPALVFSRVKSYDSVSYQHL